MRMTNKIMQNNSLYNINNNKMLQDKLSTQMATQKKITRPSDDPVIAIRALRLRSDVAQITQYYEKNAPDAESWLDVTADALDTTTEVLKSMLEQSGKGSNEHLTVKDLDVIVTQLKALRDEFYATGNVDYAGRYIFTGLRTDTTLSYTEDTIQDFKITEQITISAVDSTNYTNIGDLKGIAKENYDPIVDGAIDSDKIQNGDIYRIQLSYDNLKDGQVPPSIQYVQNATTVPPTMDDLIDPNDITTMSSTASPNPYEYINDIAHTNEAVLIPETGELLIGKGLYETIKGKVGNDTEIRVTYEKDSWKDGDMRPQHYFACTDQTKNIDYNMSKDEASGNNYISCEGKSQVIQYDVGYNQKIRINTTAAEVFTLNLDRSIDDLEKALASLNEIQKSKDNLDKMLEGMTEGQAGYDKLKHSCDAAEKAYTYIRDNMQKMFEGLTTKIQDVSDNTNVAITDNGTRGKRLDLVSSRLMAQKTTFKTLQSANEDVDLTEVTIQLTSMEYSYQSALMATSKIMQNSLMNYI